MLSEEIIWKEISHQQQLQKQTKCSSSEKLALSCLSKGANDEQPLLLVGICLLPQGAVVADIVQTRVPQCPP